jgi:prepilin-type N-terminal cleavage/methylation domain-containing protein
MRIKEIFSKTKIQSGFTLIEMLLAIAITGIIITSISTIVVQTMTSSSTDRNRMQAVKQVENAVHWIDRDAQMANPSGWTNGLTPGTTFADLLHLYWVDGTVNPSQIHDVTYTLNPNGVLQRIDSETAENTVIANHISVFNGIYSDPNHDGNYVLTINITSAIEGFRGAQETRTLYVVPRLPILVGTGG